LFDKWRLIKLELNSEAMKKISSVIRLAVFSSLFLFLSIRPAYGDEIDTSFGNITTGDNMAAALAQKFLTIAIGIAGGVAFLMMVFGAYRLMFSAGNPEAVQEGREVITAAIAGLVIIVFSVFCT
jgi:hypothetical protein